MTGFALAYTYTKEPRFLEVSRKAAEVFLQNLPADFVPYWDFTFNDHIPDIRDSSAARFLPADCWNWHSMRTTPRPRETAPPPGPLFAASTTIIFCMTPTARAC